MIQTYLLGVWLLHHEPSLWAKKLANRIYVLTIAGGPSPKSRTQDDTYLGVADWNYGVDK